MNVGLGIIRSDNEGKLATLLVLALDVGSG